ncbi:MAG TPA: uroporphyrinogen-III synthase [Crenotrichaceae bacterium]|nr:uroporphyrinogen-III synthase [Crenotrichaceae bacterium]
MPDCPTRLQGTRVLVTRPEHQNQHLSRLIEQAGGIAIQFPVLAIVASDNSRSINRKLSTTQIYDWIIFTSANAVNYAIEMSKHQLPISDNTKIAAIGSRTAQSLQDYGISVDLIPKNANSEGLLAALQMQQIQHQQCLIIKGEGGRSVLAASLKQQGADVHTVDVYRRICPDVNADNLLNQWQHEPINYVTITSIETLNNLISIIGIKGFRLLRDTTIVALSKRVHDEALSKGLPNVLTATTISDAGIIESIVMKQKIDLDSAPRVQSN